MNSESSTSSVEADSHQRINGVIFTLPSSLDDVEIDDEDEVESLFESLKKAIGDADIKHCNQFYQMGGNRTWVLEFKEPHSPDHLFGTNFVYKCVKIDLGDPNAPRTEIAV